MATQKLLSGYNLALLFGFIFIFVGILGFIPNPLVSPTGLFMVNVPHNFVHILTGLLILSGPFLFKGREATLLIIAGLAYGLVAVLGLIMGEGMLLGFIMINRVDNFLHVALSAALLIAGFMSRNQITRPV
jgi:hypothetical protein